MGNQVEAWIVADPDAMEAYYGQKFTRNSLPARQNLEEEPKADIYKKIEQATQKTQKGAYGKIKHASQLLARISPKRVSERCPHFGVLTDWLDGVIANAP